MFCLFGENSSHFHSTCPLKSEAVIPILCITWELIVELNCITALCVKALRAISFMGFLVPQRNRKNTTGHFQKLMHLSLAKLIVL